MGTLKLKLLTKGNHKVKRQNHRREEILLFIHHRTNKKLVPRIYIELLQVNKQKIKNTKEKISKGGYEEIIHKKGNLNDQET